MQFRHWGAVAKDGSHVRGVLSAASHEDAECLLTQGWTDRLKELYEVLPVIVTVDETARALMQTANRGR